MEEHPRAHSVLQIRTPHTDMSQATSTSPKNRKSRFLTHLQGLIRIPARKSKDNDNNPYSRRTLPKDVGPKPYMSQPMLGLTTSSRNQYQFPDQDGENSSEQSTSPDHSPSRSEYPTIQISQTPRSRKRMTTSITSAAAVKTGIDNNVRPRGASIDGLLGSMNSRIRTPISKNGISGENASPRAPETSKSTTVLNGGPDSQTHPLHPPVNPLPTSTASPRSPNSALNTRSDVSSTISTPPSAFRTSASNTIAPPASASSSHRPIGMKFSSSLDPSMTSSNSGMLISNSVHRSAPSTPHTGNEKRAMNGVTRLVLPASNHRFSMTTLDGSPARLSPSIIMRPPPLPILNLPQLPEKHAQPEARSSRAGLRSMPALPIQGGSRGVLAHEEADDGEEDEDDEDDDDGSAEAGVRGGLPRSSIDSEISVHNLERVEGSRASSYQTAPDTPSQLRSDYTLGRVLTSNVNVLPDVDTSRLDLSFLARSSSIANGKGKAKEQSPDSMRTPVASPTRLSIITHGADLKGDYFNVHIHDPLPISARTLHPHQNNHVSPARTPRPEDAFTSPMTLPLPPRTTDFLAPTLGGLTKHPGMYKRASRSLIDVDAIGKRERMEKIIKDEGEALEQKRLAKEKEMAEGKSKENKSQQSSVELGRTPSSTAQAKLNRAPSYEALAESHPLRRRRSMPTFTAQTLPPPYPTFAPYASGQVSHIMPRDDEGKEKLPPYKNEIYIKGIMPRKMEFSEPGIQAKDRKWRRVLCVLEGTVLKVYRCPTGYSGVSAIGEWWESKVGVGDVSMSPVATGAGLNGPVGGSGGSRAVSLVPQETESTRIEKADSENVVDVQTDLHVPPEEPQISLPQSRSALHLAVNLFKPSRHGRAHSETLRSPSTPRLPRPSLNIPRPMTPSGDRSFSPSTQSSESGRSFNISNTSSSGILTPTSTSTSSRSRLRNSTNAGTQTPVPTHPLGKEPAKDDIPDPDLSDIIKAYSMQHAESGLGNDYLKRKHVIRVRLEGEQFLLQAKDIAGVVEWIEALQAATNIALDLDERPMPRGPLFPRRRRRRRPIGTDTITTTVGTAGAITSSSVGR